MKCIIADNDPHQFRFVLWFYAQMLQYPQYKSIWAVFIGGQGTGKSTVMQLVQEWIGRNKFLSTSSPEFNVWGRFNAIMICKYFIELSEINKSNFYNQSEKVKQILEDPLFVVEQKNVDSRMCESFHHGCVNTNSKTPVVPDRRWGPVRCSDAMAVGCTAWAILTPPAIAARPSVLAAQRVTRRTESQPQPRRPR